MGHEIMIKKVLILGIIAIFILIILSSGCTNTEEGNRNQESFGITITNIEKIDYNETDGSSKVYLNLTIENDRNSAIRVYRSNFNLYLKDGKYYDPNYFDTNVFGEEYLDPKHLEPGQKVSTFLGFKVYSQSEPDHLRYHRGSYDFTTDL